MPIPVMSEAAVAASGRPRAESGLLRDPLARRGDDADLVSQPSEHVDESIGTEKLDATAEQIADSWLSDSKERGWLAERRFAASTVLGVISALAIWTVYSASLLRHGRQDVGMALAWNGPISLVFFVLAWDAGLAVLLLPFKDYLRLYGAVVAVWILGLFLLYLRLVLKSVDISGHMAWSFVLLSQALVLGVPRWFAAVVALVLLEVAYFKFVLLGGPSGANGLVAGVCLATLLVVLSWWCRSPSGVE